MRNKFDSQLDTLNSKLIDMGESIENMIVLAIRSIEQAPNKSIVGRIEELEKKLNEQEKEIENLCLELLLQQQHVAGNLRLISSALKMIGNMERIGDQALDISEITLFLSSEKYIKKIQDIPLMASAAAKMVTQAVEAFVEKDISLAVQVIRDDDNVDSLFHKVKDELINLIHMNPSNGGQALDLLMIAKYFERIGDHATNIAECVVFSITGSTKADEID